ncbi:MAG: isochorismatase family protein [Verrucomicrobia bacterium]|nr:isochorismatase family protein [Verrucomicrobiota bacterium]
MRGALNCIATAKWLARPNLSARQRAPSRFLFLVATFLAVWLAGSALSAAATFDPRLQSRDPKTGAVVLNPATLDPKKTAIVVIDMWDRHWCKTYTARVGNLVPRMNETVAAARQLGIQIVWAPSDVLDFYKDSPQRKAMQAIPAHAPPPQLAFNPPQAPQGDYCECGPDQPCKTHGKAWSRQHPDLVIAEGDLLGDCNNGRELLNLCAARGLDTLLYMGVASNMCVCYRGFGMINLRKHGLRTIFVADLVEAIMANGFNPATKTLDPNFTPAKGTAIVQRFLEQHVAPSIESRQLLATAGLAKHGGDKRPHLVFVIADEEYKTEQTLPAFARDHLEKDFRCTFLLAKAGHGEGRDEVPGLEALYDADVLVLSMRRRFLSVPQMDHLERFIRAGKPLVAVRVSVVPFAEGAGVTRSGAGRVVWQRFDQEVLGCDYKSYDRKSRATGCDVWALPDAREHALIRGLGNARFHSPSWLYRMRPLASTVTPLLLARSSADTEPEPVAWVNTHEGGRVFYTTLGHWEDFKLEPFRRLLRNAVCWATGREIE